MDISLLSKKTIAKLGSKVNDHNNNGSAIKLSDFALKQMKKMGWNEGEGLGRNSDGIKHHIIIKKREDSTGLGSDIVDITSNRSAIDDVDESWWNKTFANNLKNMKIKNLDGKIKKIKKDKKRNRSSSSSSGINGDNDDLRLVDIDRMDDPTFEDLFKATGGKRLGMRARSEQKGKMLRTECIDGNISSSVVTLSGLEIQSMTHDKVSTVVDQTKNKIVTVDGSVGNDDVMDGSVGNDQESCNNHKLKKLKKLKKSKSNK